MADLISRAKRAEAELGAHKGLKTLAPYVVKRARAAIRDLIEALEKKAEPTPNTNKKARRKKTDD